MQNTRRSLIVLKASRRPAARVICFPYAGGNAAFVYNWSKFLPDHLELQGVKYPGRDGRSEESLLNTPQSIADSLIEEVVELADIPLIFFGYSLGALIAYEMSSKLMQGGLHAPSELIVAASRAPHVSRASTRLSSLPNSELVAKLRSYGGTAESVLQDQNLMRHFLPVIRADFAAAENYQHTQCAPLGCPITAVCGSSDLSVDHSGVAAWRAHTSSNFAQHTLDGGHFFLNAQLPVLVSIVRQAAERHVPRAGNAANGGANR